MNNQYSSIFRARMGRLNVIVCQLICFLFCFLNFCAKFQLFLMRKYVRLLGSYIRLIASFTFCHRSAVGRAYRLAIFMEWPCSGAPCGFGKVELDCSIVGGVGLRCYCRLPLSVSASLDYGGEGGVIVDIQHCRRCRTSTS